MTSERSKCPACACATVERIARGHYRCTTCFDEGDFFDELERDRHVAHIEALTAKLAAAEATVERVRAELETACQAISRVRTLVDVAEVYGNRIAPERVIAALDGADRGE